LFDASESDYWQTSLLISIDNNFEISYIPLVKHGNAVRLANKEKAKEIMLQFMQRSNEILIDGFVKEKYSDFSKSMIHNYLLRLSGKRRSFIFRVINRISGYRYCKWYIKHRFSQADLMAIQNYIECEAHKELLIEGLKCQIK
jgi:poly-gamma-glutamate synthesis protein (capsule biosynthesis protein)